MDFDHSSKEFLNDLLSKGQQLIQAKWNQDFVKSSSWLNTSPFEISKSIAEVNDLKDAKKYQESFEKSRCTVKTVEAYPSSMLENKQELLAYVYGCMGETCMEMWHLNDALEYHEKAKTIAEGNDFKDAKSRACFNIGEVFYRKGKYQQAIDVWTEELSNVSTPVGSCLFNFEMSRCHLKLENYLEALKHADMSLSATAKGDKDIKFYATVVFAVSEAKLELNHAVKTFIEASLMANKMNDRKTENSIDFVIRNRGYAGFRNNRIDRKPLEIKVLDDWFSQLYRRHDHWTETFRNLEHFQRKISLREEAMPDQMLNIFKDILETKSKGITPNILQLATDLLECSESHLSSICQSKDELMTFVYSFLGSAYLEIGDSVSAMQYYEMSYRIASDNHLIEAQLMAILNLGRVHTQKRDYLQAIELLLQKQFTAKLFESTSLNLEIGRCFLDMGYYMEALDFGRRSMISENKTDNLESHLDSVLLVAHAEVKMGFDLSAEQTIAEAVSVIDALNDQRVQLIARIIQREVSCLPGEYEYGTPIIDSLQRLYHRPGCWEPKRYDHLSLRRKAIPNKILRTLQEMHDAHFSTSHAVALQKSSDIIHTLENHHQDEALVYHELLAEVYYYMGSAYLGLAHMERFRKAKNLPKSVPEYKALCDRLMALREKEEYKTMIKMIEEKLSNGIVKSDLELTLLKAWIGRCYLRWSLVTGERAVAAAVKVADKESQLYVFVLAVLCEVRLSFYPGICPAFQLASIAARIKKARNMARIVDDKMAVHVMHSILQEIKERYTLDITSFLGKSDDVARPFSPIDEDDHQTDPDETTRKSDGTEPVQETAPFEETEPKELDIDPKLPNEETNPKVSALDSSIRDEEEETSPKEFNTDPVKTVEETNLKEIYPDEYHMFARGDPEGDSNPSTS